MAAQNFTLSVEVSANNEAEAKQSLNALQNMYKVYPAEDIILLGDLMKNKTNKAVIDGQLKALKLKKGAGKVANKAKSVFKGF